SRTIRAPTFWNLSASSISLTTVTPSLVTVGAPQLFWSITFRPRGPSVTRAASASRSTPSRMPSRARSWSSTSLAGMAGPSSRSGCDDAPGRPGRGLLAENTDASAGLGSSDGAAVHSAVDSVGYDGNAAGSESRGQPGTAFVSAFSTLTGGGP